MLRKVLILLLVLVFATGCSGREEAGEGTSDTSSGSDGRTAAASWENAGTVLHPGSKIIGNTLYFIQGQRDVSTGRYTDASICRKVKGMGHEEEILHMGAGELVMYLIDEEESLYCLYAEEKRDYMEFFLKKAARDGTIIYNTRVCEQEQPEGQEALSQIGSVTMGEVDRDGSICLANASGSIYLFDPDGQLVCTGIAGWDEETFLNNGCGLANAGENGIFTYQTETRYICKR